jgi:hypothetical protein
MFLRATRRQKDGKEHRYFSIVENRRLASGKVVQRTVLYLGEINDSQQAAWRKTLEAFDEKEQRTRTLSLFPEDREIPADAVDAVQVKLSQLELRRPRTFGGCWLGCEIWRDLGLQEFWEQRLGEQRGEVDWTKVLQVLVLNRLIEPGSEFRIHRHWFDASALDELLGVDFEVAEKDRLYRCLDRSVATQEGVVPVLKERWRNLFNARYEVLLYDLTSTYFEGERKTTRRRDARVQPRRRPDCLQVVIALVISSDGFPIACEVMNGNTADSTTLDLSKQDRTDLRKGRSHVGDGPRIRPKRSWPRCVIRPARSRTWWDPEGSDPAQRAALAGPPGRRCGNRSRSNCLPRTANSLSG